MKTKGNTKHQKENNTTKNKTKGKKKCQQVNTTNNDKQQNTSLK